jgi:uncharacterized protein YcbK (DUF882 family)
MDRRGFLRAVAGASLVACTSPLFAATKDSDFWNRPRTLWLIRQSTGEQVKATYWADGKIATAGYVDVCKLLRDVKANQAVQMSLPLLDILRGLQGWFEINGQRRPLVVNSGYRTHRTNNATEGASRNSKHLEGRASDIYVPDVSVELLGRMAMYLKSGGVGFYQTQGFLHVDDGNLRTWSK